MSTQFPMFERLADWKDFERLCIALLSAESYIIESEPMVDRSGVDITVSEEYRSHADVTSVIRIRWRVQCKHLSVSGKNLGREEVEKAIYNYESAKRIGEGLFIIVDTDYTEPAKEVIDKYLSNHPEAQVKVWNRRQLATKLERHPHLLARFGLSFPRHDYTSVLANLSNFGSVPTLFISDQSAMAHNLASALRAAGFNITFIPFWNYQEPTRMELLKSNVLTNNFRLVICFLGDSFGIPMPLSLVDIIYQCYENGASLLLFPFLAWSMTRRGFYQSLHSIVPVKLQDDVSSFLHLTGKRIIGSPKGGDFRDLLLFDFFAEDQYSELDPIDGRSPFTDGINSRFGLSHSFEYLMVKAEAQLVWRDTAGNPTIAISENDKSRICYLNTCCHSCMTPVAISSPLEAAPEMGYLVRNIIKWLIE